MVFNANQSGWEKYMKNKNTKRINPLYDLTVDGDSIPLLVSLLVLINFLNDSYCVDTR